MTSMPLAPRYEYDVIYNYVVIVGFFPLFGMLLLPIIKYGFPAEFTLAFWISQGIAFIILLVLSVTYTPPSVSLEEIDGPEGEVYEMHETAGKFLCVDISLWLFSWTWLDLRCMYPLLGYCVIFDIAIVSPLAIFVFFYSFWWIPRIVMGYPYLSSRFPSPRTIKDLEKDFS